MPNASDHDEKVILAARVALICAVAGCLCLVGAVGVWAWAQWGSGAMAGLKPAASVMVGVSATAIAAAFVAALIAIGQAMLARVQLAGETYVQAALLLCLLWTAGMIGWERFAM